ncbi:hypothetical protein BU14_0464s0001 [Porphyra umbilicalis]|uniref:Vesicle transport protein n=1 Tax=Porphyra umbilicalis TaxID=2786 RepID=A0A1X6NU77_PORUM|nr:hypothetical protein BU14_0464s0001 [Porphyra umbilicalis]|eukprot:OSX72127.1 hypothetical protein BU14_0464s0001 [Porphyra umbilicalis]
MLRRSSSALAMGLWDSFPSVNGTTSTASGGTTTTTTTATATLPPSSAAAALVAGAASLRASGNGGGGQGDAFSQFAAGGQTAADVLGARASEVGTNVNDAFRGGWAAVSRMVGADDGAPIDVEACANGNGGQQSVQQEIGEMFNLSWVQRLTLFVMCFSAGAVMIGLSFMFLPMILLKPHKFAAAFTAGNLLAIMSTWVIVGPRAQLASMFHPARATAAAAYIGSLIFALFAAFFGGRLRYPLVLISLVVEVLALVWYSLSYIPFGRQALSRLTGISW